MAPGGLISEGPAGDSLLQVKTGINTYIITSSKIFMYTHTFLVQSHMKHIIVKIIKVMHLTQLVVLVSD